MTGGNSTASITGAGFIGEDMAQQEPPGVTCCRAHSARSKPAAVERLSSDGRLWRAIEDSRTARKTVFQHHGAARRSPPGEPKGCAHLSRRQRRGEAVIGLSMRSTGHP